MPNRQRHRGQHPGDAEAFGARQVPLLRTAVHDLSWLLSRGYSRTGALKLVGDRYQITARQRTAVDRCACSDDALERRRRHRVACEDLAGETLDVDGYNLLITVESALAGGIVLRGRDGCLRDLASLHGSYRKVEETRPALECIGARVAELAPGRVQWHFDQPVSNSGRLKTLLTQMAAERGWPWTVSLCANPDPLLAESAHVVVSADSWVIDRAARWAHIAGWVLEGAAAAAVIDLA